MLVVVPCLRFPGRGQASGQFLSDHCTFDSSPHGPISGAVVFGPDRSQHAAKQARSLGVVGTFGHGPTSVALHEGAGADRVADAKVIHASRSRQRHRPSTPHDLRYAFMTLRRCQSARCRDVAGHADLGRHGGITARLRHNLDRHRTYLIAGMVK